MINRGAADGALSSGEYSRHVTYARASATGWLRWVSLVLACTATAGCGGHSSPTPSIFRGDVRELVLTQRDVPAKFALSEPALDQDLYDEASPAEYPWLFAGGDRPDQRVKAAFSEFRSGTVQLRSAAYSAPNSSIAHAMVLAARQLLGHSIASVTQAPGGAPVSHVPVVTTPEAVGSEGVLLTGPGLNGEGTQAVVWRHGSLVGAIAVDGAHRDVGKPLVAKLARRQDSIFARVQ
jgi:hypothetical protein